MHDKYFLQKAIDVGNEVEAPYNFGAVVVKDGEIIASAHGHVYDTFDPSAHSEVSAPKEAGKKLQTYPLTGCTLYASHEPCMMCFSCAAWAEIDRIVYCTSANEQKDFMYEFKDFGVEEANNKLRRPMNIIQMTMTN